jgi:hypothetical protein
MILLKQQRDAFVIWYYNSSKGKKKGYKTGDVNPVSGNHSGDWRMYNRMLYYGDVVYIPACAVLRQEILYVHYNNP